MEGSVRVLVVEDAPDMRMIVSDTLRADGFVVIEAADGRSGIEAVESEQPDVVILDLVLPDMDGFEVCRAIRERSDAYVLMLTGKTDDVDAVIGLSVGADDYMTKPFSPRLLVARIRALLRRTRVAAPDDGPDDDIRRLGPLEVDDAAREVRMEGELIALTRIEYDLLATMSARPRQVYTRAQLLDRVWGPEWIGDDHLLEVHISKLRRKLGDSPQAKGLIHTVRGVGYRFDIPAT